MARILVTGGAGFVGSNVVDGLLARGDQVVAIDDLSTGAAANLDRRAPNLAVNVADGRALGRAMEGQRFDAVVHCASKTKVVESFEKPELYRRVIVDGTRNVLDVARATGATSFVNFSSGGVIYGETPECASEERDPAPASPYGAAKAEAEALVAASELRWITLRPANIYGPRQRTDLEGGVVAIFLRRWHRGQPLVVFGDGSNERDYVYVEDVVEATLAALDASTSGTYNVGTGVATSVNELIARMSGLLGPPPAVERTPAKPELRRSCLDVSKAERDGLWRPRTSLEEGLLLTWEHERRSEAPPTA
ncbi:MAG: NAD-dependent epimerase/dehydratase family protein [Candidatus Limnocylindria bacterium]